MLKFDFKFPGLHKSFVAVSHSRSKVNCLCWKGVLFSAFAFGCWISTILSFCCMCLLGLLNISFLLCLNFEIEIVFSKWQLELWLSLPTHNNTHTLKYNPFYHSVTRFNQSTKYIVHHRQNSNQKIGQILNWYIGLWYPIYVYERLFFK